MAGEAAEGVTQPSRSARGKRRRAKLKFNIPIAGIVALRR